MDCTVRLQYDGSGFDELGAENDGHDGHYHIPVTLGASGSHLCARSSASGYEDVDEPIQQVDVLVREDAVEFELDWAFSPDALGTFTTEVATHLYDEYGVDASDEGNGEWFTYDSVQEWGCIHPVASSGDVLELFDEEVVEETLDVERAVKVGLRVPDAPYDAKRLDFDSGSVYFPDESDRVVAIDADEVGDAPDVAVQLSREAANRLCQTTPYDELDHTYSEADLFPKDAPIPWLYVHGKGAVEFWNAIAPKLFDHRLDDEELVREVADQLGLSETRAIELWASLVATLEHECPIHPQVNLREHVETVKDIEGVASPANESDHGWAGGREVWAEVQRRDSLDSDSSPDYPVRTPQSPHEY